jgi:hypothetical protein
MDGDSLLVVSADPAACNPQVMRLLVSAGAEVTYAHEVRRNLEDLYMKVIGGSR